MRKRHGKPHDIRAKELWDELVAAKALVGSDRTVSFVIFLQRPRFQQVVSPIAHVPDEILHRGRGKSSGRVHRVTFFQYVARRFVTVPFFSQDVLWLSCRENKNNWQQINFRASQDSAHESSGNILLFLHCLSQESSVSIVRVVLESVFCVSYCNIEQK